MCQIPQQFIYRLNEVTRKKLPDLWPNLFITVAGLTSFKTFYTVKFWLKDCLDLGPATKRTGLRYPNLKNGAIRMRADAADETDNQEGEDHDSREHLKRMDQKENRNSIGILKRVRG